MSGEPKKVSPAYFNHKIIGKSEKKDGTVLD
jgi:hypothetical protein